MLGNWPLTRVCLKQTDTQKHQLDSDELSAKGKKLLEEGKFEEALAFFEQALLQNPKDPDLLNDKGAALRSLGRYDEAIDCFNQSLEIEPRDKKAS